MQQILGDEKEEAVRKGELKSILAAGFWGFCLGGLLGWIAGGYGGFLIGLFAGSMMLSLFSILGVRASRRQKLLEKRKAERSAPEKRGGPPIRGPGRTP